ncbi:MAG: repressor LexA [Planctomycetota bacterium]|nr:MAG: repressor LexA [Planctomycetota bacterium]
MSRHLTRRQLQVLAEIHRSQRETGLSPTLEEIGRALGINRTTAFGHAQALIQKGYLENLEPGASRGLELTDAGRQALGPVVGPSPHTRPAAAPPKGPNRAIPLLGRIAAGRPLEAVEVPESRPLEDFFPDQDGLYLLEVRGDSMIEDHIQEGDLVLVDRHRQPRPGDTVVAILPGEEATLKRFYPEAGGVYRLQPANSALAPIRVRQLEIRGVVLSVIRRLA